MQSVSELWRTLRALPGTEVEWRFTINGTVYGSESEVSHSVEQQLFERFGFGNAASATLGLELYANDIPRAATIKRECRLVNGEQVSEWIPKGTFFTNTRKEEDGLWHIEAMDAMRKADKVWWPNDDDEFPMQMSDFVSQACEVLGVTLDPRSVIPNRKVDFPANDQTWRQTLGFVAAAGLGNFIITENNKLRLVPLLSAPVFDDEEYSYLIDEYGNAILFGGVRIIVG